MADQIIIEFIGDTTQLQPAIDVLQNLGQIDAKAAESFKKSNAELAKRTTTLKEVNTESQKHIKTLQDVEKTVIDLGDTFTDVVKDGMAEALAEAGVGVEDLDAKLNNLKKRAADSGKSILEIVKAQEQLKQKLSDNQAIGPYQKLSKSVTEAEQKVLSLATKLNNLTSKGVNSGFLYDKLTKQLPEAQKEFAALKKQLDSVNNSTKTNITETEILAATEASLKKQLNELTAQLALLEVQGKRNTAEYSELVAKAGEIKGAIRDANEAIANTGSDTRGIDNLIGLAGALTGGFAIAQGATALFGEENEKLQRTLLKVNAAMSILQGWQQISALLSQRQFQSMAALVGMQRIQAIQTTLQAGAESSYTVVRYGAIAAQKTLNAVMAASPLGVTLVLVGAIAAAYSIFRNRTDEVAEASTKLNTSLKEKYELDKQIRDLYPSLNKQLEENLKLTLALLEASGKGSTLQLLSLRQKIAEQTKNTAQEELNISEKKNGTLEENKTKLIEVNNQLKRNAQIDVSVAEIRSKLATEELSDKQKFFNLSEILRLSNQKNSEEEVKALTTKKALLEAIVGDQQVLSSTIKENAAEEQKLKAQQTKEEYDNSLKSAIALAEAKVIAARNGSIAEQRARLEVAKAVAKEQNANPNLTDGEREKIKQQLIRTGKEVANAISAIKIEAEKNVLEERLATVKEGSNEELELKKQIAAKAADIEINALDISAAKKKALQAQKQQEQDEYDRQIEERKLQFELTGIQTRLAQVKKGSAEEFELTVKQITKQHQIEINAKGVTDAKKEQLEAEYWEKVLDLSKQYNRKIQKEAINTKQSETNTKIYELQSAALSESDAELLRLKKEAIDEQAQLDIIAANDTITDEKQKQAKIKEIIAKANAEKLALDQGYLKSKRAHMNELADLDLENERKGLQIQLLSANTSILQKIAARKRLQQINKAFIDAEWKNNEFSYKRNLISYEVYLKKRRELEGKYLALDLQKEQEKQQRKQQIVEAGFSVLQSLSDALFDSAAEKRQAELEDTIAKLEAAKAAELDNLNLTEQQKTDINKKYSDLEKKEKRKAWEADKKAKKEQAVINGLLGITQAIATSQNIYAGLILAAVVAANTAIQVGKIAATRFPAYKKGTKYAAKGYALVGEEGPEIIKLSGGEKIYKYKDSMKIAKAWRGGSTASADDILTMGGRLPSADKEIISNSYVTNAGTLYLDYDKLGAAVASKIPTPITNNIVMDENGFTKSIIENGNKTTIKNQRYKFS